MRKLAIAVGIFALITAWSGFYLNNEMTLLLAATSAGEAVALWFSGRVSAFLKVLMVIFAVETLLFGAVYLISHLGYWPPSLVAFLIPDSLALAVSLFGIAVYAVSHLSVVRKIMALADPYFTTSEIAICGVWPLPRMSLKLSRLAALMVVFLVLLNQIEVAISVRLSFVNQALFNALQVKNASQFWHLIFFVLLPWAMVFIAAVVIEFVTTSYLVLRWRRFLTQHFTTRWLSHSTHYRMAVARMQTDNPDQRIQDDINAFIDGGTNRIFGSNTSYGVYGYSISLIAQMTSLVSYAIVLWVLSRNFTLPGTALIIPGLLFWVAVLYAGAGTLFTHLIGRPLVRLAFAQQRFEANFRFGLARLREYSEQVALLNGEPRETSAIKGRFQSIFDNYLKIIRIRKFLTMFLNFLGQINSLVPLVVAAPFYFLGKIKLGVMMQTLQSFSQVQSSLTFFMDSYTSMADFAAVVNRLTTFEADIARARLLGIAPPHIQHIAAASTDLTLQGVSVGKPDGGTIVTVPDLVLRRGQSALISGPSGSGKSSLLRAISGIWPFGEGKVSPPEGASLMLLPQRPYIPIGTLRAAITYPAAPEDFSDETIRAALVRAQLPDYVGRLDDEDIWSQRLSGGEQQRVALARALLAKPDWLFLDEATAALDEATEARLYRALHEALPQTTIISIGHRASLTAYHQRQIAMQPGADGIFSPQDVVSMAAE